MSTCDIASARAQAFIQRVQVRFYKHLERHPNVSWNAIAVALKTVPERLGAVMQMEASGGEPDVVV